MMLSSCGDVVKLFLLHLYQNRIYRIDRIKTEIRGGDSDGYCSPSLVSILTILYIPVKHPSRIASRQNQSGAFRQAEHQIQVLDGLPRRSLNQVVERDEYDRLAAGPPRGGERVKAQRQSGREGGGVGDAPRLFDPIPIHLGEAVDKVALRRHCRVVAPIELLEHRGAAETKISRQIDDPERRGK